MSTEHVHTLSLLVLAPSSTEKVVPSEAVLKAKSQSEPIRVYQESGRYHVIDGSEVIAALQQLKIPFVKAFIVAKPVAKKPPAAPEQTPQPTPAKTPPQK